MSYQVKNTEKRFISDRRRRATPVISKYTFFGGQRHKSRREPDKTKYVFVDLYSPLLLIMLLSILLLNYVDAYLTLTLINKGIVVEANPLMALHLESGTIHFILNKFLITTLSIIVFCLFKNIGIARMGVSFSVMMYLSVVLYQFYLIF